MAAARLALVTGASGFLGSHLADTLLARGWAVRGLVRRSSNLRWLPRERMELAYGDVGDAGADLDGALAGVDTVFHVAGVIFASGEDGYMRVNRDGARRLAEAANRAGARRFVLVSSQAAGGPSRRGRPNREDDPPRPGGAYGRSKLAGETAVAEAAAMPWTVVRPVSVYGPRDAEFLKLYRLVKRGLVPEVSSRQEMSFIDVRDLSAGIVDAAESEAAKGRVYNLCHPEIASLRRVGEIAARALGRRYRGVPVPAGMLPVVAGALAAACALVGRRSPFPVDRVNDLRATSWTTSPERAAADFGFRPRHDAETGIPHAVAWCRDEGWL